jgi:hypothetical protein
MLFLEEILKQINLIILNEKKNLKKNERNIELIFNFFFFDFLQI